MRERRVVPLPGVASCPSAQRDDHLLSHLCKSFILLARVSRGCPVSSCVYRCEPHRCRFLHILLTHIDSGTECARSSLCAPRCGLQVCGVCVSRVWTLLPQTNATPTPKHRHLPLAHPPHARLCGSPRGTRGVARTCSGAAATAAKTQRSSAAGGHITVWAREASPLRRCPASPSRSVLLAPSDFDTVLKVDQLEGLALDAPQRDWLRRQRQEQASQHGRGQASEHAFDGRGGA